jgi:hypothetical protein
MMVVILQVALDHLTLRVPFTDTDRQDLASNRYEAMAFAVAPKASNSTMGISEKICVVGNSAPFLFNGDFGPSNLAGLNPTPPPLA